MLQDPLADKMFWKISHNGTQEGIEQVKKEAEACADVARNYALSAQYRLLGELEELFPKNSKHKVAGVIDKKMREILKQLR
jgi:hypothetical protein